MPCVLTFVTIQGVSGQPQELLDLSEMGCPRLLGTRYVLQLLFIEKSHNSATTEAREKIRTDLESFEF
jgi:hypothetical protein